MSIMVMNEVFKRYPEGGGEMLLALALADHAHDDGTHIWPSIAQLAQKTRQSERSVQYQLRKMEATGWLILVNSGNGGRNQRREYWISPDWIKGAEIAPPQKGEIGDMKGAEICAKGANCDTKGCSLLHPHITIKEPSKTTKESSGRGSRLPKTWLLPKSWGTWALENDETWTVDHVRMEADKFRDYWVALPGKAGLKLEWEATWRNWCRNAGPMKPEKAGGGAWWATLESKNAKAIEVGVGPALPGESDAVWTARIRAAIDNGGKPPMRAAAPVVAIRETPEQIDKDTGTASTKTRIPEEERQKMLAAVSVRRKAG